MRVVVVGDDLQAAGTIGQALQAEGFLATLYHHVNPHATCDRLSQSRCDAVVLDCQRQSCSGACLLRQYTQPATLNSHPSAPVLVLAAQPTISAQVTCLKAGAEVFLVQPVQPRLLVTQIHAMIRRAVSYQATAPVASSCGNCPHRLLRVADLILDPAARTAWRRTKTVKLTQREAELLEVLMRSPGKLFCLKDLAAAVWGRPLKPGSNVVAVNIARLRKKLDNGFDPRLILTIHGKGYKLSADS
jgi:DNA-binding response OmpR family regulator